MQEYQFNTHELQDLLDQKQYLVLRAKLEHLNEVDVALFIENLPKREAVTVFRLLDKEVGADVFANLPIENQQLIINSIGDQELAEILDDLAVDDAVDMIGELPANVVFRVLKTAHPDTRNLINHFLKYPDNSAGSIMTAEFVDLKKEITVKDAIKRIRETAEDKETIYTCYVTDKERKLEGIVTIKDLLLNSDETIVSSIMETDIISVKTTDDREEAANILNKYDFLSVPVVDTENRLVGIVTVDDAVDVITDEATEDFEIMAPVAPSEKPYLKTNVFTLAKNRIVWLLVLMISAMITGTILGKFQSAFVALPLLVTFIPMITDTGGNAGSQSSTLIIRGMAVGELQPRDFFKILFKELRVSLLVGSVLALVNFLRIIIFYKDASMLVALTVSIAILFTIILSKSLGCTLPIIAKKIHVDPAMMAAPMITTIVDACSLAIYFTLAKEILHL